MSNGLSIAGSDGDLGLIECPACQQTIEASSERCRFCSATIDPVAAKAAAQELSKINCACSDASFLGTAAISMLVFIGVMFVPFMGLLGLVGYYFLLIAVPVLAVRWWVKFHLLESEDADFKRAKGTVTIVSILVLIPITLALMHFL